jgi:hypothetical protein
MKHKNTIPEPNINEVNTNWSTPSLSLFSAINSLRKALSSGYKAQLIRMVNEDCAYPILEDIKKLKQDFREYTGNGAYMQTREDILNNTSYSDFEKHLMLNYNTVFGTREAMLEYYQTGKLSKDNFFGAGISHLVKVSDMVEYLKANNQDGSETERIDIFTKQYLTLETSGKKQWYDNVKPINARNNRVPKKFNHKVWVVQILNEKQGKPNIPLYQRFLIKTFNMVLYPLKFIPVKSVLRMNEYSNYTFRIGDVVNGFSVEFQIPKKFKF